MIVLLFLLGVTATATAAASAILAVLLFGVARAAIGTANTLFTALFGMNDISGCTTDDQNDRRNTQNIR